jgi:hypothetical protein
MKKLNLKILALKIFLILAAIPILYLDILIFPSLLELAVYSEYPLIGHVVILIISVYFLTMPYFLSLYKAFGLLIMIEKKEFFSMQAISHLKMIVISAYSATLILLVDMPILYMIVDYDDSPGLLLMGLLVLAIALFIAIFTSVLRSVVKTKVIENNTITENKD